MRILLSRWHCNSFIAHSKPSLTRITLKVLTVVPETHKIS